MKKAFDTKIFDIVSSIVETVVAISLIILIILVGFQRFSTRGNLFGYRIYTVASGSMIPTYNIGDTLLIKEMSSENIKVGDAVTYMGETGGVDGLIITHQVQQVDIDENGKYSFHTKGIANNIEDPIVYEEQVLGKVVHKFFILSIIGRVTTSMPLLFAFVAIPVAILVAIEIIKIVYKSDDDEDDEEEDEIGDSPKDKPLPEEPVVKEKVEEKPIGPVVKEIKVVEDTSLEKPFIVKMPTKPIEVQEKKEEPKKEEPKPKPQKKEVPKKEEQPKKEEVKKETPKKEVIKKEEPKPVEFKKEDLTNEEFIEELKKELEQVEEEQPEKKHRRRRRKRK